MIWQQVQLMKGTSFTAYLPMLLNNLARLPLKHLHAALTEKYFAEKLCYNESLEEFKSSRKKGAVRHVHDRTA